MIDLVIPTIGRSSLRSLLASLERARGPRPNRVFVVDDRRDRTAPLELGELDDDLRARVAVLAGRAAGPAAARNTGWRASRAEWIAFVDDDVLLSETWLEDLAGDLRDLPAEVAGSQAIVTVPLPSDRRATDWERNVAGLASAQWITADCAYRRADLVAAGGFDERFPRAYREDADLALRLVARGKGIVRGTRRTAHPVRPADWAVSIRLQAGNADDVLMDALHGKDWRARAGAPRGAYRSHLATVATAAAALGAFAARKPRLGALLAGAWAAQAARFAWKRIAPGPRTPHEIGALALTSVAIPFAAVYHRMRGYACLRTLLADQTRAPQPVETPSTELPTDTPAPAMPVDAIPAAIPRAVLFDRDGTLVVDVPHNADPARVQAMPGAREAVERLRAAGVATAVISNQPGVALGTLTRADVDAVNARIERELGRLGPVFVCTHAAADGCGCRKPAPGMIHDAARALGVTPQECVVVGDIGADVEAALNAGARAVLVPTPVTLAEEIAAAPFVARDLGEAVAIVLRWRELGDVPRVPDDAARVRAEAAA